MLRLSIISCLSFLSLLLFSFSCADHVVPTNPVPAKIKTLEVTRNGDIVNFGLQFEDLGNIPITEFGVLLVDGNIGITPDLSATRIIFMPPADLNTKFKAGPNLTAGPGGIKQFSYRAYAILNNGNAVFGEVKSKIISPD